MDLSIRTSKENGSFDVFVNDALITSYYTFEEAKNAGMRDLKFLAMGRMSTYTIYLNDLRWELESLKYKLDKIVDCRRAIELMDSQARTRVDEEGLKDRVWFLTREIGRVEQSITDYGLKIEAIKQALSELEDIK